MGLFDRNNNDRGFRAGGYDGRSYESGGDPRGMNRGQGNTSRQREGLWSNSFSDGAWTADAADRTERDWHLGQGRGRYDNDTRPSEAGWRAGGMSGGTGMNRGGMNRGGNNWNLEGGDWGHNWGSGNLGSGNTGGGYAARGMDYDRDLDRGGMNRGGGFLDRAQNALRRGWDQVEDRFDRDDNDRGMHMGGGSMRGGTSWAGNYDREYGARGDTGVRGYRDDEGHYGVTSADTMNRGGYSAMGGYGGGMQSGMNRYGADYDRGMMDRADMDSDRGYRSRQQIDNGDPFGDRQNRTPIRVVEGNRGGMGNRGRYDENFRDRNRY
ncbi:hypothetical protein [Longimicrobium sp.]|uniref:hypothetical protein n=1 Tax=Longimicrobium sp. TaxID=2029185 RepID=UPI003B3AC950